MSNDIPYYISKELFEQAAVRANHAAHEFHQLVTTPHYVDAQRHWRNFLEAADDVFERLDLATRSHEDAKKAWAMEKKARKEDPLLQWMQQARNADKHNNTPSIELVTGSTSGDFKAGESVSYTRSETMPILGMPEIRSTVKFDVIDPKRLNIVHAWLRMLPVTSRGVTYAPPLLHKGALIRSSQPNIKSEDARVAASLTLHYISGLILRCMPR